MTTPSLRRRPHGKAFGVIARLLALILLFSIAHGTARAVDKNRIPPIARLDGISLDSDHTWLLRILPDGSGQLAYGSALYGMVPAGTFDFAEVYRTLSLAVLPYGVFPEHAEGKAPTSVTFDEKKKTMLYGRHTKSPDYALKLIETAKQKAVSRHGRKIEEPQPPAPKKQPLLPSARPATARSRGFAGSPMARLPWVK